MAHPLPSEYTFGKVIGRAVHAIADTAADEDHLPEARAAVGRVVFRPRTTVRKAVHDYSAFVLKSTVHADLDSLGRIVDAEGRLGIWLVTGHYAVTFDLADGQIPGFTIEVTDAHTDESPLDLVTAAPPQPGPGITVQTLIVPSGAALGQVLGWTPDGLGWVDPEVAGDVSPEVIEARDTAVSAASSAQGSATAAAQSAVDAGNDRVLAQQAAADALAISVQPPEKGDKGDKGDPGEKGDKGDKGDTGAPGALADAASYILTGPGRPDVPATTGGIITGAEPIGAEYRSTDGAGVGAWVWMKRPTGWVVDSATTGPRSLKALMPGTVTFVNPSWDWVVGRTLNTVNMAATFQVSTTHAIVDALSTGVVLPLGFRIATANYFDLGANDAAKGGRILVQAGVEFRLWVSATASTRTLNVSWQTTEPWPSTLPGTAAT